jgi:long-chain acyl-CoA synthetase
MHWRDDAGQVYFRTGDLGRLDEDGFLYVLDRKKDMIISGGLNIYASDLEHVLLEHEAVAETAVIGVPSEQWGETPLALVVRKPGVDVTPEALVLWANERLGKSQRISKVEWREELPKTPVGKVLKRELRAPYWSRSSH